MDGGGTESRTKGLGTKIQLVAQLTVSQRRLGSEVPE